MSTLLPPLVSAAELHARLGDAGLRIIDVRSAAMGGGRAAFEAAHIPGAVHTDYAADGWRVNVGGAPGMMPTPPALAALIGRLDLTPDMQAVIVCAGTGASDFAAAARVYWTLKVAGHRAVSLLDGGMSGWVQDGSRPVEHGGGHPYGMTPYPVQLVPALRAEAGDVLAALGAGSANLVDARSPSYFRGAEKAGEAKTAGHIPGAINIDYVTAYAPATQRLLPAADLADLFGDVPPGPVISYCNTGHTAALNWFVLSELQGRAVSLYDGSMTDWTQDPARPVATV